jgi:hypothetical protein
LLLATAAGRIGLVQAGHTALPAVKGQPAEGKRRGNLCFWLQCAVAGGRRQAGLYIAQPAASSLQHSKAQKAKGEAKGNAKAKGAKKTSTFAFGYSVQLQRATTFAFGYATQRQKARQQHSKAQKAKVQLPKLRKITGKETEGTQEREIKETKFFFNLFSRGGIYHTIK